MIKIEIITYKVNLFLGQKDMKKITIKQSSNLVHRLVVRLFSTDLIKTLSDYTYVFSAKRADGTKYLIDSNNNSDLIYIDTDNHSIIIECTGNTNEDLLIVPGSVDCEISVFKDSQALYTNTFYLYIDENVLTGNELQSSASDEFKSLNETLKESIETKEKIDTIYAELESNGIIIVAEEQPASQTNGCHWYKIYD